MSTLLCRSRPAFLLTAAALAMLAVVPSGTLAAGGESTPPVTPASSTPAETSPASNEWSPQGSGGEAPSGGAPPLQHGSSVGSGVVPSKAPSTGEESSTASTPSDYYEPEASTPATPVTTPIPSTSDETTSVPAASAAPSGHSQPEPAPVATPETSGATDVAVGNATPIAHSAPPQVDSTSSAPAAVAPLANSDDQGSAGTYVLALLAILALGFILAFAWTRFKRLQRQQQLEALWREQDAAWDAAIRRAELREVPVAPEPSATPLRRVGVG